MRGDESLHHTSAAIGGSVVDHDDLESLVRLACDALERLGQEAAVGAFGVVHGNDDRYEWCTGLKRRRRGGCLARCCRRGPGRGRSGQARGQDRGAHSPPEMGDSPHGHRRRASSVARGLSSQGSPRRHSRAGVIEDVDDPGQAACVPSAKACPQVSQI